ncbi:hypothetical protein DFR24_4363 [Panacagrimonas perspica]|uniref:Uncharacterized protein n=1 Tax=Panacagrimonas perspica TaxID=381431 RepID=A0A4S3K3U0_9GAMM|nr:hypothetical protein [Panacagrimonas perspica]TDU25916.1 hypothetical protein DFR24_4363 [Panacagrimonas perspica]THD02725.1 hypothetical protein B1810_12415 [Panacagrimonas perspica]
MSYYTFANLQYPDGGAIDPSEFSEGLVILLNEHGLHRDVGKGLIDLFTQGEAFFTFYGGCAALETFLLWVSKQRPEVPFGVQGRGEDLRDVWVREFLGGSVTYEQGPFTE